MHYIKYKETISRGTANFPVGYYHVNQNHPQYDMPYHWHEELEFIHILEGSFDVTINENNYIALPGDILIVNSGFLHGGVPHSCVYECLVFPINLLLGKTFSSSFLEMLNMQDLTLKEYHPATPANRFHALINELFHTLSSRMHLPEEHTLTECPTGYLMGDTQNEYQITAYGLLYQIMGCLYEGRCYEASDRLNIVKHKNIYLLKNVLDYIETNYPQKIQLNTLAKTAGMSPKYFCRFFYEMTNRTPIDYVNYYRIERACYLLVSTGESITEASLSCGFNDMSYFIKTFKKYKGMPPRQFLKNPM